MKRFSFALLFAIAGLIAGLVVSGRVRTADTVDAPEVQARPQASTAPPRPTVATAGPDFTRVAESAVPAVANISSVQVVRQRMSPFFSDPFFQQFFGDDEMFGPRNRYASSLGSGVIVAADGYVVTNNHVLGEGQITKVTVALADKREVEATIVGVDSWTDLAVLKINASGLPVIPWGDSSRLKVAEWVMAIGNPYQLSETVTLGIVSALGRANVGISQYEDFIQTDAAINPGNSGGALVNARGELVGINTAIFTQSGGYQGIGFAVPSNLARRIVSELIQYGQVRRGSIGFMEVAPLTTRVAEELGAPVSTEGVVIVRMARGGAAFDAGIEPGDVILSVNGQKISDGAQLVKIIADAPIGSTVNVEVLRDGRRRTYKVAVQRLEDRPRTRRNG
jgi:Do/DeqQ family serine protease